MVYVPTPPPPPSREATELSEYLNRVIDAYREEHPELKDEDVVRALEIARPANPHAARAIAAVAVVIVLVIAAVVFVAVAKNGGF